MNKIKQENEILHLAQISLILTITIFSIVIFILNILLDWDLWMLPLVFMFATVCNYLHITRKLSSKARLYIYSIILMTEIFYYAVNINTVYDSAPVVIVAMVVIAMTQDKLLHNSCLIVGLFGMVFHLIDIKDTNLFMPSGAPLIRSIWAFSLVILGGILSNQLISLFKRLEEKYTENINTLEIENNSARDFLANISHEIRTPINAIIGLTGVCVTKETDPEIRNTMESVEQAGKRVAMQINDILDYSEIDMDSLSVNNEDYMISSVINDINNELESYMSPDVELIYDIDLDIPSVMHSDVDKLKKILRHLIFNSLKYTKNGGVFVRITSVKQDYGINLCIELTDTGIGMSETEVEYAFDKFYQSDSGRTRSTNGLGLGLPIVAGFVRALGGFISLESTKDVGTTIFISIPQIVVDDTHCMTVPVKDDKFIGIFYRFDKYNYPAVRDFYVSTIRNFVSNLNLNTHRVNNLTELRELLTSVRLTHLFIGNYEYDKDPAYFEELAKKMIVVITADNTFNLPEGSNIRIMRKPINGFPIINVINNDIVSEDDPNLKMLINSVHALVVDDEPMNLTVAESIFESYGMTVSTAYSGSNAINLCRETNYDIIFMDHMMPKMDGIEAMKIIRKEAEGTDRNCPIIALTANAASSAKEMFLSEGFDGFVSKPIDVVELERVLKRFISDEKISYISTESVTNPNNPFSGTASSDDSKTERTIKALSALGINTESGLQYYNNDWDFYTSLLLQFANDGMTKRQNCSEFLAHNDLKDYTVIVHSLKSTSKMIGALAFSDMAKDLEAAGKSGDAAYISSNHDEFILRHTELTDGIFRALGATPKVNDTESSTEILEFIPKEK